MSRKGISILPFAFIALVVSLGIISWNFYNVYYGSRYQATVFEHSKIDTMRNEMEKGKKFLKQSCIYSSHQALFENAAGGGIIPSEGQSKSWICNTPQPPSFSKTKGCVETFTKFYVNSYFDNYSINLPIDMAKAPYKSATYNISVKDAFRGKLDEGSMDVLLNGAKMSLSTKNLQVTDNLNKKEVIDKNRFWYMWRNFHKWSQRNVYGKGICKCTSSCKGCDCAEKVAKKALKDLERRFDKYVTCEKSCGCCYGCQGSDCGVEEKASCKTYCNPSKCLSWRQRKCTSKCKRKCANPEGNFSLVIKDIFENPYIKTDVPILKSESESKSKSESKKDKEKCCPIYKENKLSAVYTFSCIDKKYYIPGGHGPEPMTFSVKAFASWKDKDGCGCKMQCPCKSCPQNKGKTCE